jgi:hypothetical protein
MIGYRALPMRPQKAFAGEEDRMLSLPCFISRKRAFQEGVKRFDEPNAPVSFRVEDVDDVRPYFVRWTDESGTSIEDIVLLPNDPTVFASSVVDLYLQSIVGEHILHVVRQATDEEVRRLSA